MVVVVKQGLRAAADIPALVECRRPWPRLQGGEHGAARADRAGSWREPAR